MRAKLFFALLFVSLLWAGTVALGQKIAVERPALPREPVQTACHYRTAYQAFHLIGEAG